MRILIAEDDEARGKLMRQGLEGEHDTVAVFTDGGLPRAAASETAYDRVNLI